MKVYLVWLYIEMLEGVFSTQEKAEEYCARKAFDEDDYSIQEVVVDEALETQPL